MNIENGHSYGEMLSHCNVPSRGAAGDFFFPREASMKSEKREKNFDGEGWKISPFFCSDFDEILSEFRRNFAEIRCFF